MKHFLFIILLVIAAGNSFSQYNYSLFQDIEVIEDGKLLSYPWAGGLNSPQINYDDIDGDGIKDYVLFERTGGFVKVLMGSEDGSFKYSAAFHNLLFNLTVT